MIAYKGFDKDLKCRGFQFEVGQTYKHEGPVKACQSGFHACENPFDVWDYYPIIDDGGNLARFAEVEIAGDTDRDGNKIASAEITIKAELKLPDFVRRAVDAIIAATKGNGDDASGYSAQIGSSGNYAQIGSSGYSAQIGASGEYAQIGASGEYAQIGSSGYSAKIGASGEYARIGSSGYSAQIGASGNYAKIGSSGYSAKIDCSGENAVVASAGGATKARGKIGTWISLASFDSAGKCNGFGTGCIGQDGLLPDTWYRAEAGKLVLA